MKFTEQLRHFDDAELDPFQFRLLCHYWRVGTCWESTRTTAEKCKMSVGKVSTTRQWLLDQQWIRLVIEKGRKGVVICSPREQKRSPHEQSVHHVNAILNGPLLNGPYEERDRARGKPADLDAEISRYLAANGIPLPSNENDWEAIRHPAALIWLDVTQRFPGWNNLGFVVQGLGDEPNRTALEAAWQLWQAHGFRTANVAGIIDWQQKLAADPNWQPQARSKQNGRHKPLSDAPKQPDITAEDIEWARQALTVGSNA